MNTTNQKEDGSRWKMLFGEKPETIFVTWGATDIYCVPNEDRKRTERGPTWFIKLEDGYHYAHSDGTSCYAAPQAFYVESGEIAFLEHGLMVAIGHVESAERSLADAITVRDRWAAEKALYFLEKRKEVA